MLVKKVTKPAGSREFCFGGLRKERQIFYDRRTENVL